MNTTVAQEEKTNKKTKRTMTTTMRNREDSIPISDDLLGPPFLGLLCSLHSFHNVAGGGLVDDECDKEDDDNDDDHSEKKFW